MIQSQANLTPGNARLVTGGRPVTPKSTDPAVAGLARPAGNRGRLFSVFGIGLGLLTVGSPALRAGSIYVPNGSFELPETVYADPRNDLWQEAPVPFWYDETANGPWGQLTGVFLNPAANSTNHIDNMDGKQGAFFFALPGVALFQDYSSTWGTNTTPAHEFNTRFEVGKSYDLTVGVIGGGGGMANGVTMELSLYYRDGASNRVTVAATTVTNQPATFSNNTNFIDFQVHVPAVKADDAWAGQNIGVQLLSTVGFDLMSGYWDLDNVRLTETIVVPNGSFELPETVYADPRNDLWQEAPVPFWYDETANGPWGQLTGVFLNPAANSTNHIDNMDGKQGAFFFALPGVALFQDYSSTWGTNTTPAHEFNTRFEVGKSYQLAVGVIGGGGGMANGVTMELSLYYRDGASNRVTVAATTVTNQPATFSNNTNFIDFQVQVPAVKADDAWAGQNIGVQLLSTVGFDLMGGYWDLDNVRLAAVREPVLREPTRTNGQFQFTLQSEPGLGFEVLATTDLTLAKPNWTVLGTLTNVTGTALFIDAAPNFNQRFYQARQLP